jgi:death on curing protein
MTEPVWIDERDALAIHDRLPPLHGGATGLRDDTLLKLALARPRQRTAPSIPWGLCTIILLSMAISARDFSSESFFSNSTAIGLVPARNPRRKAVLELAAGRLDETGYSAFLRDNVTRRTKK